jgi:glycerol-3-phosphate dehydrogenase (NAD(P)+)
VTEIAVVGAGSWGTAVSWLLGRKAVSVRLWARETEIAEGIAAERRNPLYLTDVVLPETVVASHDMERVLSGISAVVVVTPSHGVRETAEAMKPFLGADTPIVNLAKGVEEGTHLRMTEVLAEVLGSPGRLAALSGPNHAEEVSRGVPSATVIAAYAESVGRLFQQLFITPTFRVYTNPDVIGVELGGASKNVIAVAAGMSDGLGYGDNTKATLMTRGLAEISRLGRHLGANPLTYMGLAGMGDLIATCTSKHSRNRALGEWIATGGSVDGYTQTTHMVAEGARSAIALSELGESVGIEMPIIAAVRSVLYGGVSPVEAGASLMGREASDELHGIGLLGDDE